MKKEKSAETLSEEVEKLEKKKKVQELSEQLKEELLPPKPLPFKFEDVSEAKIKKIRPDFDRIVETIFIEDLHEDWEKLKKALRLGEKRTNYSSVLEALDNAETNAYNAHRLFLSAKFEFETWKKKNDVVLGAMWSAANRTLQKEKNDGLRSKQITDGDIKAYCNTLFPDEYPEQEILREKYERIVDSLESLAEQWKSRCKTLQTMKSTMR